MEATIASQRTLNEMQLSIASHPTDHSVACAGMDGVVSLWAISDTSQEDGSECVSEFRQVASVKPYKSSCRCVRFWPASASFLPRLCLLSASSKGTLIVHDAVSLETLVRIDKAHESTISCICALNWMRIATGDEEGKLKIWHVDEATRQLRVAAEFDLGEHVIEMKIARRFLLVTAGDCSLKAYDFRKGKLIFESEQLDSELTSIALLNVNTTTTNDASNEATMEESAAPAESNEEDAGPKRKRTKTKAKAKVNTNANAYVICGAENGMLNVFRFGEFGNVLTRYELCADTSIHSVCSIDKGASDSSASTLVFGCEDGRIRVVECDALDFRSTLLRVVGDQSTSKMGSESSVSKKKKKMMRSEIWSVAASCDGTYLFTADGDAQLTAFRLQRNASLLPDSRPSNSVPVEAPKKAKQQKKAKRDDGTTASSNNFFSGLLAT